MLHFFQIFCSLCRLIPVSTVLAKTKHCCINTALTAGDDEEDLARNTCQHMHQAAISVYPNLKKIVPEDCFCVAYDSCAQ